MEELATSVVDNYKQVYPELNSNKDFILNELGVEEERFGKTLESGMARVAKYAHEAKDLGAFVFDLYQSYGFPFEMAVEELLTNKVDFEVMAVRKAFDELFLKHQELSRVGAEEKFKGGLADHSEQTTKYHTATHLLQAALRQILGDHVRQMGSNITAERMRFDFSHPREISADQIRAIEALVNEKIGKDLEVKRQEMSNQEADRLGALSVPRVVYGEQVSVYLVADGEAVFSMEKCGGPHVGRTSGLGTFKITKLESIGQGIKRIKAVLV
jgi:alanyl-tRNA synthetase